LYKSRHLEVEKALPFGDDVEAFAAQRPPYRQPLNQPEDKKSSILSVEIRAEDALLGTFPDDPGYHAMQPSHQTVKGLAEDFVFSVEFAGE
jgi:hypothetical protein